MSHQPPTDTANTAPAGASAREAFDARTTTSYHPAELPPRIGKFLVVGQLGQGTFGTVYKARDPQLSRLVAIKVPRAGALGSAAQAERFLREARAAAQLDHPNIVKVLEVAHENGLPYIVSEYVEGLTLADRLTGDRPDFRTAAGLVAQVADALAHAHRQGVIHRDVKPGNILLDLAGRPHVADFGLARHDEGEGTLTVEGQVLGTPAYMSPEQADGERGAVDGRTDVYSLGVVLYELLTGELPFRGNTRMLLHQLLHDDPKPPRKLNDAVPRDLETVCLKCLRKEAGQRYGSARELADDLRRFLDGVPIRARPSAAWERALKWARRRPAAAGLLAVSVLALAALGGGGLWHDRQLEAALKQVQSQRDEATQARADADARREETRRHLYVAHLNLAQQAWQDAQVPRVLDLLDGQEPRRDGDTDLRGFEWHYWRRLCHSDLLTLGHAEAPGGHPAAVAFSPDGTRIASGGADTAVRVWDARTGRLLRALEGHTQPVWSVAFSPDGKSLASGGADMTVRVWDAATGRLDLTCRGHTAAVTGLAFGPEGKRLASASLDATVKVWDAAGGQEVRTIRGHGDRVMGVAYSPDGKRLASACSGTNAVRLWDAETGRELLTFRGHEDFVSGVAYSPDDRRLASTSNDKTVRVWDVQTGKELLALRGHAWFTSGVTFSRDGKRLASTSQDRTVRVWDVVTGQELLTFRGHTGPVSGVAFDPGGTRLASVGSDGTVKVWDATVPQEALPLLGLTQMATGVVFSPDGLRVAASSDDARGPVRLWDVASGREVLVLQGAPPLRDGLAFSADGHRLLGASRLQSLQVWDATTGQTLPTPEAARGPLDVAACSADGRRLAAVGSDRVVKVWDVTSGREIFALMKSASPVVRLVFSRDGARLAVASQDKTVGIWDVDAGQELCTPRGSWTGGQAMAFSPDATTLAKADGAEVKVWDARTGQELLTLKGHTGAVDSLAYSPDGRRLATGGIDLTVKVWDLGTGQEVLTLKGHTSHVSSLAFSPDGHRLASGSGLRDRSVRVWNAVPLEAEHARDARPGP